MTNLNNDIVPRIRLQEKIDSINLLGDIPKPALILEGKTDVSVYSRILKLSEVDIKKYDIVVGECKTKILNAHDDGQVPFKYVALLDSDFDRYNNKCRLENNLIYTHFYDMENYLTTNDVVSATFSDLDDAYTKNVEISELHDKMIELINGFIVAIKYKLECLDKVGKGEEIPIFPLEDVSIFNDVWWNKRDKKVDIEKIKGHLVEFYKQKNMDFNYELWDNIIIKVKEEFKYGLENNPTDFIIKGRRLIEAYQVVFGYYLGQVMKKRDRDVFMNDLRKNIDKSTYVEDLVKEIDTKLEPILA